MALSGRRLAEIPGSGRPLRRWHERCSNLALFPLHPFPVTDCPQSVGRLVPERTLRINAMDDAPEKQPETTRAEAPRPPIYHSSELFGHHDEVWIEHGADMYRLRKTKSGKLYLTK
jgi:hemin uptake protein HemP